MKKISITATIRDAYRFTLAHFGAIVGLIWLPMILVTVIGFFVMQRYYDAFADALASGNYNMMGPELLGLLCYFVAALLLSTMMWVPVAQLALGQRKGGALLHFAFGNLEWRLFRSLIGLVGFMLLPLLVAAVISGVLQAMGKTSLNAANVMTVLELLVIIFYIACVYFGLRFLFLLPAVVVTEDKPPLAQTWLLTIGNFWRIFAVMLATALPVLIVTMIAIGFVEGRNQPVLPALTSSTAMLAAQVHAMSMNMPLTSGIGFLVAPLLLGLWLGAAASVYRTLTASTPGEAA